MAPLDVGRFQVFGFQHLIILGFFVLGCIAAYRFGRFHGDTVVSRLAGVVILLSCAPFEVADWIGAHHDWSTDLPIQICDFAWLIAALALMTGGRHWSALLYFWGLTLCLQGVLTPDLDHLFPDPQFFGFWVRHLAPVWAGVYLIGARRGPGWREYRFTLGITALWAAALIALNTEFNANYGYFNGKPAIHSLLDYLGPWPWYIAWEVVLVIIVWALMTWPWAHFQEIDEEVSQDQHLRA